MAPALTFMPSFELSENYKRFIKSPQWKAICARYWATYGRKCQACGSRQNLHVHHKDYSRFGGKELLTDLCGLCHTCHRNVHAVHRSNRSISLRLVTERYVMAKRMGK